MTVRYVQAPQPYTGPGPVLFLAGGISGCADWQAEAVALLRDAPGLTVLDPRRSAFDLADPAVATEQITWEHTHLHRADVVLFWFAPGGSVQPITLYELGVHVTRGVPLAVGADPAYPRRLDVRVQLALARPGLIVHDTLADTVAAAELLSSARAEPMNRVHEP
ncbi:nucleoside 2-deoxyribosyltransferase domain-containing protein [Actinoplanes sp. NPDC049599]|uniref:nucleoside 2-deoxyribosyltransferase domain-containing protein n=1 Tax=Actinoplanes sp. NPDC049599 TaxID=3363903 RepID=UPI00379905F3